MIAEIIHEAMNEYNNLTALKIRGKEITYKEIDEYALTIAYIMLREGIKGKNIGIFGQRNYSAYVGILGTIYSGNAYVPINKKYPKAKINDMIQNADIRVIVSSVEDLQLLKSVILIENLQLLVIPEGYVEKQDNVKIVDFNDISKNNKIGSSHHFLLSFKNSHNSKNIESFDIILIFILILLY